MNREFLEEYAAKELEQYKEFRNRIAEGKYASICTYPPKNRFSKAREPMAINSTHSGSIWSQIPLFGSLIIPIFPRRKEQFLEVHTFELTDIERLVELSKDTGRVQFALTANPVDYADLDFLNPIFTDLEPPLLFKVPYQLIFGDRIVNKYRTEFETLASINFAPLVYSKYREGVAGITLDYILKRLDDFASDYIILKGLGYENIVTELSDAMISDPDRAIQILATYSSFLSGPWADALKAIRTRSFEDIKRLREEAGRLVPVELPCEVGRFLMRKLTLYADGYRACVNLMDTYKQQELHQVMTSLMSGLRSRNVDVLAKKTDELSIIFDNIWSDAKSLSRSSSILQYGIPFEIAIIGEIIGMLTKTSLGGVVGLLAAIGFKVAEESIKVGADRISEKIAKIGEPNYITTIYDFQRKIKVN